MYKITKRYFMRCARDESTMNSDATDDSSWVIAGADDGLRTYYKRTPSPNWRVCCPVISAAT